MSPIWFICGFVVSIAVVILTDNTVEHHKSKQKGKA